jgi:Bacterial membrane protein YfhO
LDPSNLSLSDGDGSRLGRQDAWILAFLVLLPALIFADVVFGGSGFFLRDLTRYYYPTKHIVRELLRSGHFPYWNPFYSGGQPLASNPEYEVFYPFQWLICLPSYDLGYQLHILVHFSIAAVGMFLLLRSLNLRRASSLFGAICFACGGPFLSLVNLLPMMFCAAWIPWILLCVIRFAFERSRKDAVGVVLFCALQILIGEPVTILETWMLAIGCAMYCGRLRAGSWKGSVGSAGRTLGLLAVSVAVSAVQVLPAIDLVHRSARARGFTLAEASYWSLPPARLLEMVFAHLFGHAPLGPGGYFLARLYPTEHLPFLLSLSIGSVAIVFVLAGLLARRRGSGAFLAVCGVFCVIAVGGHLPVFVWLHEAPILRTLRFPEKFSLGIAVAAVAWAAFVFDDFCRGSRVVLRSAAVVSGLLGAVSAGVWLALRGTAVERWVARFWPLEFPGGARVLASISRDWFTSVLTFAAILAGLLLARRRLRLASCMLLAVAAVELFALTREIAPRQPAYYFTPPSAARQLRANRGSYRIFHQADWHDASPTSRLYFRSSPQLYWTIRNGMFPWTPAAWGYSVVLQRDIDRTALLPTVDLVEAMVEVKKAGRPDWAEIFMGMSNAAYDAVFRAYPEEMRRIRGDWRKVAPIEFIGRRTPPRFSFATSLIRIRNRSDFVDRIVRGEASGGAAFVFSEPFVPAAGHVHVVEENPGRIVAELQAGGPAFLVISITPDKDWSATLDGKLIPLDTVNVGYQGARIPAGAHRFEMRYRDPLFGIGGAISFAALLALALVVGTEKRSGEPAAPSR